MRFGHREASSALIGRTQLSASTPSRSHTSMVTTALVNLIALMGEYAATAAALAVFAQQLPNGATSTLD